MRICAFLCSQPYKMADTMFKGVLLLTIFKVVYCGYLCTKTETGANYEIRRTMYCTTSCCGTSDNVYCCEEDTYLLNLAAIIGIALGGVVALALLITLFAALCICCAKRHTRNGQVIAPATRAVAPTGEAFVVYTVPNHPGQSGKPPQRYNQGSSGAEQALPPSSPPPPAYEEVDTKGHGKQPPPPYSNDKPVLKSET